MAAPQSTGTRPRELPWSGSQASLHRILLDVCADSVELGVGSDQMIVAFILPKGSVSTHKKIGLVRGKSFERTQPFCSRHMRGCQKMNVVRHHDESMEFIPVKRPISVSQRGRQHRCNFRPPQKQRTSRARVQDAVDSYERLPRRDECRWWEHAIAGKTAMQSKSDKEGLVGSVPMGQPAFIVPHTSSWCLNGPYILNLEGGQSWPQRPFRRLSRLKAGCGQYCPPHGAGA